MQPRFPLGQTVATPGALQALLDARVGNAELLGRHQRGDWGELDDHDWRVNEDALTHGDRLLSAYTLETGVKVWVITEWDRSVTTILLPEEY